MPRKKVNQERVERNFTTLLTLFRDKSRFWISVSPEGVITLNSKGDKETHTIALSDAEILALYLVLKEITYHVKQRIEDKVWKAFDNEDKKEGNE